MKRGYHHFSQAWYAQHNQVDFVDQVSFGLYHPEGGTQGEMSVTWCKIGWDVFPRLEVFDDAWAVMQEHCMGLLSKLHKDMTPKQFCAILEAEGFVDMTNRVNPRAEVA